MTVQELIDKLQEVKKCDRDSTVHVIPAPEDGIFRGDVQEVLIQGQHTTLVIDMC